MLFPCEIQMETMSISDISFIIFPRRRFTNIMGCVLHAEFTRISSSKSLWNLFEYAHCCSGTDGDSRVQQASASAVRKDWGLGGPVLVIGVSQRLDPSDQTFSTYLWISDKCFLWENPFNSSCFLILLIEVTEFRVDWSCVVLVMEWLMFS